MIAPARMHDTRDHAGPMISHCHSDTEIYRSSDHRVFRRIDQASQPLIVKRWNEDNPAPILQWTLHNEIRMLERLQGVPGCPSLVGCDPEHRELVMADFGGVALDQSGLLGTVDLDLFLSLSLALAGAVAALHAHGVIHKDLNPANILVRPDEGLVQIIDFGLATAFEEHPDFDHPSRLVGTLPYLSPEQTGRMNRPVDYRSDLYSLGATLYALATGTPPFDDTSPLRIINAHLTLMPEPPAQRAPWLPPPLSDLILALLAKEPDERYQSASGLAHDLRLIQAARTNGGLGAVRLKQRDLPLSPHAPRRLYGRDRDLAALMAAFAGVRQGGARGLFVAGYSGIGKTSLIHEIHRPVTLADGLFISGKFEQFQRDHPFMGPAQCLRQLCQLLLAEPEAAVEHWRTGILAAVGPDAGALFDVVPELEALLGPQPAVPDLGPLETQIRLRALLIALMGRVATPGHPLVVFLDDLQWADQPSLDFVGALLGEPGLDGLLLIGAYRDNEVDAAHPLTRLLRQPTRAGKPAPVLKLDNLQAEDIAALLADMLRLTPDAVRSLADGLYAKTNGNPFFTVELVTALYRKGSLWPDPEAGRWRWDAAAISGYWASANVVDFLAEGLAALPSDGLEALVAAACLGADPCLGTLAVALGETDLGALAARLAPALERGIIVTASALAFTQAEATVLIRFCHDRMQQAVYQQRQGGGRDQLHLAIARRFAGTGSGGSTDPGLQFRAAEHYAAAVSLVVDPAERMVARRLFLDAARQARQSGSFATAERFLRRAIELLPPEAWMGEADEAFTLQAELHLCLYSQSRHAEADEVYTRLAAHPGQPLRLVEPTCVQLVSLSNRTRYDEGIRLGSRLLHQLGVTLPLDAALPALEQELEAFYRLVEPGALEQLANRPTLDDPHRRGAAKLMNRMIPAAFFTDPLISFWLAVRCGRRWCEEGYLDPSLYPMACITLATIALRGDYRTGYRAARAALEIGKAREAGPETARTQHVFALFCNPWFEPLEASLTQAHAAFTGLLRAGDLEFACFTFFTSQAALLDTGTDLLQLKAETTAALGMAAKSGNRHAEQSFLAFRQLVRALEGKTKRPGAFDAATFSEAAYECDIRPNAMALCFYHIYRSLSACLFDDREMLAVHADAAMKLLPYITGFYPTAIATLLQSLALIDRLATGDDSGRPAVLARLDANQAWLAARAADAAMNFSPCLSG